MVWRSSRFTQSSCLIATTAAGEQANFSLTPCFTTSVFTGSIHDLQIYNPLRLTLSSFVHSLPSNHHLSTSVFINNKDLVRSPFHSFPTTKTIAS